MRSRDDQEFIDKIRRSFALSKWEKEDIIREMIPKPFYERGYYPKSSSFVIPRNCYQNYNIRKR